jgi:hypothetical protein
MRVPTTAGCVADGCQARTAVAVASYRKAWTNRYRETPDFKSINEIRPELMVEAAGVEPF